MPSIRLICTQSCNHTSEHTLYMHCKYHAQIMKIHISLAYFEGKRKIPDIFDCHQDRVTSKSPSQKVIECLRKSGSATSQAENSLHHLLLPSFSSSSSPFPLFFSSTLGKKTKYICLCFLSINLLLLFLALDSPGKPSFLLLPCEGVGALPYVCF